MSGGPGEGRSGFSAPADENSERIHQLAKVTAELGAADTIDAIVDAAVTHAAAAIRAAVTTLMLREGDHLRLVGGRGLRPGILERWHSFPVADANPASQAFREGLPVLVNNPDDIGSRYPGMAADVPAGRSVVCLPLGSGDDRVGVAGLTFDEAWLPGPRELDLLMTFAAACGQAVRRVRAADEAAQRAWQLRFLADASEELSRSLDYRATLTRVAELCVPELADWCAVDIVEREGLVTLAVAHADPAKVAWAWDIQRKYPPDRNAPTGAPNVVRTGLSELYEDIPDEMLIHRSRDEEHLRLSRELQLRSAIVVPLRVRNRTLGTITLIRAESDRRYGSLDLPFAEELGRRAALAIDNAQLHSATRDVARELQLAVLPARLDTIQGWPIAVHSDPGGSAHIGGDFYDALPLPDNRLAVFIGDVMGHGIDAAAAMAHMRAALRAYISVDPTPAVVLGKLEKMFGLLGTTRLVTLVFALIDPAADSVELVNAGHYAPLIVSADGTARFAQTTPRRPLGTDPDDRTSSAFPFGTGDTLLLYTDGLVERRDEH
ncbi:MAG TPA: SpoIIE family protein phosphatase, partial [Jatrophihabitans sp.]|nr:SpoIIE family protein phosphatase [Jatrophihabitans sp.]